MHELTPEVVRRLKAHGMSDADIDELRRTGSVQHVKSVGGNVSFSINGTEIDSVDLDPTTLEALRQFNRFIPNAARDQIELATGQDLDGDGQIGGTGAANPAPARQPAPSQPAGGPFVRQTKTRTLLPWLVAEAAVVAFVVWWFFIR